MLAGAGAIGSVELKNGSAGTNASGSDSDSGSGSGSGSGSAFAVCKTSPAGSFLRYDTHIHRQLLQTSLALTSPTSSSDCHSASRSNSSNDNDKNTTSLGCGGQVTYSEVDAAIAISPAFYIIGLADGVVRAASTTASDAGAARDTGGIGIGTDIERVVEIKSRVSRVSHIPHLHDLVRIYI